MLDTLLKLIVDKDGSDLYLSVGTPPSMKVQGKLLKIGKKDLSAEDVKKIALNIMDQDQARDFDKKPEMNLAIDSQK